MPPGLSREELVLVQLVRIWRLARDAGEAPMPALARRLERGGDAVLAPVIDGLMRAYERLLARSMRLGSDGGASGDERRLLAMLRGGTIARGMGEGDRALLRHALRSAAIMLRLGGMASRTA